MIDKSHELVRISKFALEKYAEFDPDREKSGKSIKETFEDYITANGGRSKKKISDYTKEYRAILDNEYPDTPEGYEKLRSALVDRNGKIVSIVKDFETIYNRINNPSRKRNLEKVSYAVSVMAKFYINCQDFWHRIFGFEDALSDKCRHNPSLKD